MYVCNMFKSSDIGACMRRMGDTGLDFTFFKKLTHTHTTIETSSSDLFFLFSISKPFPLLAME